MKPFGIADKRGCVTIPKVIAPSRIDVNLNGFVNALGKLDEFAGIAASDKQAYFIMSAWGWPSFFPSVYVYFSYTD